MESAKDIENIKLAVLPISGAELSVYCIWLDNQWDIIVPDRPLEPDVT